MNACIRAVVESLLEGRTGVMAGIVNGQLAHTPLKQAVKRLDTLNPHLSRLIEILST